MFEIIDDTPTTDKTVFLRCDLDVKLDKNGKIADDTKILKVIPTLHYLLKTNARVVLATHIGEPKGKVVPSLSTKVLAEYFDRYLRCDVFHANDCVGDEVKHTIFKASYGDLVVLENLKFHPEEEACDIDFAKKLVEGSNIYVNEAFTCSDKSYASILGSPLFVRSLAGFELGRDVKILNEVLQPKKKTSTLIVGEVDNQQKLQLLANFVGRTDFVVIDSKITKKQPELFERLEKLIEEYQFNRVKIIDADDQIEVKKAISKAQIVVWNDLIDTKIADNVELLKIITHLTKHKKMMSVLLGEKLSKLARYKENYTLCEPDEGAFVDYLSGKVLPGIEILHRLSKYTKKMENY